MVWKAMMVSLAGGILCLDRIALQTMVSRPVVSGPLTGWLLNDPYTGFLYGALIELLWIDRSPIGKYVPPNDTMAAVVVTAAAVMAGNHLGQCTRELSIFALLCLLPVGYLGQQLDTWIAQSNAILAKKAVRFVDSADVRGIERQHYLALMKSFVLSTVFIFAAILLGEFALFAVFPLLPPFVYRGLELSYYIIPMVGISVALTTIRQKGAFGLFCAIFAAFLMVWKWGYGF